jgi:hypothetical protein
MPELFAIWIKYWKKITAFCGVAILLSIILSMPAIMPPHFLSRAVFYPSNPALTDRNALFSEEGRTQDYFGGKADVDRLLSIAGSQPLADHMISKFNLKEHYGIKGGNYEVRRKLSGNYKAIKNSLGAIEVVVYDKDPQFATDLARAIVGYIDSTNLAMIRTTRLRSLEAFEQALLKKETELQTVSDSLSAIKSKYNIVMSEEGFIVRGSNAAAVERARVLQGIQTSLIEEVGQIKRIKGQNAMVAQDMFTTLYMVEDAFPSEKKAKPVRWMIVLGTAVAAFMAVTLFAIFSELIQGAGRRD